MSERVLSTGAARQAIAKMQAILNGPLVDQIEAVAREGQVLSDPSVWDGRLAQQFRSEWPIVHRGLTATVEALEELRAQIAQVTQDIMRAGGN